MTDRNDWEDENARLRNLLQAARDKAAEVNASKLLSREHNRAICQAKEAVKADLNDRERVLANDLLFDRFAENVLSMARSLEDISDHDEEFVEKMHLSIMAPCSMPEKKKRKLFEIAARILSQQQD